MGQPAICQIGIHVLQAFACSTRYPFLKDAACRIIRNVRMGGVFARPSTSANHQAELFHHV